MSEPHVPVTIGGRVQDDGDGGDDARVQDAELDASLGELLRVLCDGTRRLGGHLEPRGAMLLRAAEEILRRRASA